MLTHTHGSQQQNTQTVLLKISLQKPKSARTSRLREITKNDLALGRRTHPPPPSKILLVQVWTLSSSPIPRLGGSLRPFFLFCITTPQHPPSASAGSHCATNTLPRPHFATLKKTATHCREKERNSQGHSCDRSRHASITCCICSLSSPPLRPRSSARARRLRSQRSPSTRAPALPAKWAAPAFQARADPRADPPFH